jgi:hypothetical protein
VRPLPVLRSVSTVPLTVRDNGLENRINKYAAIRKHVSDRTPCGCERDAIDKNADWSPWSTRTVIMRLYFRCGDCRAHPLDTINMSFECLELHTSYGSGRWPRTGGFHYFHVDATSTIHNNSTSRS